MSQTAIVQYAFQPHFTHAHKPHPTRDLKRQKLMRYFRLKSLQTIFFGAAHSYEAYIKEYHALG